MTHEFQLKAIKTALVPFQIQNVNTFFENVI